MAHEWHADPNDGGGKWRWRWHCLRCRMSCRSQDRDVPPKDWVRLPGSVPGVGVVFWTCEEFVIHRIHAS